MKRKRSIQILAAIILVLGAIIGYGILQHKRLKERGIETFAVVTKVYSRTEYRNEGSYRRRPRRKKVTVYYLRYRFCADSSEYTDECRRTENLITARVGDSLQICYLPENPKVNRPVHRGDGSYVLKRSARSKYRTK
jgi:hypothetical protein